MATEFGKKIAEIKEAENLNRPDFCLRIDVPIPTMRSLDSPSAKSIPKYDIVQKICKTFPEYTLWLMIDQVNVEAGQISPEIKKKQRRIKYSELYS